jgi:serine/threonine protein kinase
LGVAWHARDEMLDRNIAVKAIHLSSARTPILRQ